MFARLAALLVLSSSFSFAQETAERIDSFHSDITVGQDGTLRVVETISVTAAGKEIRRGIYRDFPTLYKSKFYVQIEVPFEIESVKRNGASEPYHTQTQANGVRVYIGEKNRTLKPGEYTYELVYTTKYQIGFFDQYDELYWNVTGNGWDFPIEKASALVHLPAGIPADKVTRRGYTGKQGSKETHLTSQTTAAGIEYATTRPLGKREGLTIVAAFPKGFVQPPSKEEMRSLYFRANLSLWLVLGGLGLVCAYYAAAWLYAGRDPPRESIYPQYEPPLNLDPAGMRYIWKMGYDRTCFTAALINMAVKEFLTIEEDDGEYTLRRNKKPPKEALSPGENAIAKKLLSGESIDLAKSNHLRISEAITRLGAKLRGEYHGKLFLLNRVYLVPGWILSAAAVAAVAFSSGWAALPIIGFLSVWLSIWTLGVVMLAVAVFSAWANVLNLRSQTLHQIGNLGGAIFITLFATPFFIAEVVVGGILVSQTSIWIIPLLIGLVFLNWLFWHLIKQPTVEGRRVMDAIEGFRQYLANSQRDEFNRMHQPQETPELFERFLPYSLALDLEKPWAARFEQVLGKAVDSAGNSYRPRWYHGAALAAFTAGAFAAGLSSSLGSAVSSSSTAPGSSSGSGGGGSSGGGGGGW